VVESLIPARLRDRHRQHRENFFANPEKQAMQVIEIFAVRSDASEIPVDVSLRLLTIGTKTFAISAVRDATERRRLEALKRAEAGQREKNESEERFRLAAQAGKMYAYEWDVATDLVVRSEEQVNVLGFSEPRQLTRQELLARVHPEDRALFVTSLDQLTPQYPTTQISYRVLRPDGSIVWLEKNARGFFDEQGKLLRVIGMVANITERKQAEEALRESEERFRLVANNAPVMIWMSGLDTKPTYFNQPWLDFTGLSETDLLNGLAGIVHPEDYLQCHDVYCRGFDQRQPFRKECRLRRHDGQYRWILDIGVPRFHKDGSFAGYIGSCIDVTDRKLAEDVLTNMSRKLVQAQEQERARIARELHDDINQRLAMLGIELQQLREHYPELPVEVSSRMEELQEQTTGISTDVQALSHDLHSSQLEYLGVVAGMKSWCKEFGERQGMQVDCRHDVRSTLPQEIGLCLFRVLQEALHNAAKHSGVKRIEVQLHEESDEIHLTIRDLGKGFDVEAATKGRGLGLTSMQERIRLVNGTIEIQSKPMGGTTVHVRVPLRSEHVSQLATG
jgi:PAS domain S-box-containing protein